MWKYVFTSDYAWPSGFTRLRYMAPAFEVLSFFAILATFCQFGDFGHFLAIFLAHFDPWTICDNFLQWHFFIGPAV